MLLFDRFVRKRSFQTILRGKGGGKEIGGYVVRPTGVEEMCNEINGYPRRSIRVIKSGGY